MQDKDHNPEPLVNRCKSEIQALKRLRAVSKGNTMVSLTYWIFFISIAVLSPILLSKGVGSSFLNEDNLSMITNGITYALLFDLISKLLFIHSVGINIHQYLILPIRKKTLARYILLRILSGSPNIYYLPVLIALAITFFFPVRGLLIASLYLIIPLLILLTNSLAAFIVKETSWNKLSGAIASVAGATLLFLALRYLTNHPLNFIDLPIDRFLITLPVTAMLFIFLAYITLKFLIQRFYVSEETELSNSPDRKTPNLHSKTATTWLLIDEFYLIIRNKRTWQYVLGNIVLNILILYFLTRDFNTYSNSTSVRLMILIFSTGYAMTTYLQMSFSWQSRYFEGLLTKPIAVKQLLAAKVMLFNLYSILIFLITSLLFIENPQFLPLAFTALLCNLGINSYILTLFMLFNNRSINLSRSTIANYEGISGTQFISSVLLLSIPALLLNLCVLLSNETFGLILTCTVCATSICFHNKYLNLLAKLFPTWKYRILEGFKS